MKATDPVIQDAVGTALAQQSFIQRRKDTIVAVAGTLLQILQIAVVMGQGWPEWVALTIGAIIGTTQALIHALTKGAITPSMAQRLSDAAWELPHGRHAIVEE